MHYSTLLSVVHLASTKLFEAEDRRLNAIISSLNKQNKRLSDVQVDGFLHDGLYYLPLDSTTRAAGIYHKTPLHLTLLNEMESYLQDKKTIHDDRGFIKQILHTLLKHCHTTQNIRDTLPDCLVSLYPEFAKLRRQDEVAYTIRDDPRALRQFEKYLPKMEFYSATRLLY